MKLRKPICLLLIAVMLCLLCACGAKSGDAQDNASAEADEPAKERPAGMDSVLPGADQGDAVRTRVTPEPAEETAAAEEDEQYLIAYSMIGLDVSELYEAIGEPLSSDYSSSCLGSGQDGELRYEGFTVYTYQEEASEIIQDVIK